MRTPSVLFNGYRREVEQSPPYKADDKNEWSYTFTDPICLHAVDKE
jgi:hypothetical protein